MITLFLMSAMADDPVVSVGEVHLEGSSELLKPPELKLGGCLATPATAAAALPTAGQVGFALKVTRGKVELATVTRSSEGFEPFTACFERELLAVSWPVDTGVVHVPIQVGEEQAATQEKAGCEDCAKP